MATQYSNKPIVTDGLVYALDFGNPKSYVSGSATAQSLIYNPTPARFSTVPAGDYQGLAAAYSVRKVVSSYTGSAMMVQSASVSQSIGFDADGNLDTGSIASFAGSGDAFVKIWYDQSGNSRDAIQTSLSGQPKIYSGSQGSIILENGRPALEFDGINDQLNTTSFGFPTSSLSVAKVGMRIGTSSSYDDIGYSNNGFINVNAPTRIGFDGRPDGNYRQTDSGLAPTNNVILQFNIYDRVNMKASANGGSFGTFAVSTNTIQYGDQTLTIGAIPGAVSSTNARTQELIIWGIDQTNNKLIIENNINNYYNIYTPAADATPTSTTGFLNFTSPDSIVTNQSFPGFSYDQGNSTIMYVGETKGTSSLFTQDTNLSVVTTTSSVGFGSTSNNLGRTYPVSGLKHVTLRFSSGSVDCFVNGIPVPANSVFPTGSSVAGGKFAIPIYTGSLGGFQVYNRPLTSDEIYNNYLVQARRYSLPDIPKPYSLDENAYLFLSQSAITDPIITSSIDTFVRGLKSNNLWDKMIAIYPFVGTGSEGVNLTGSQLWNLKEPSLVTYPLSFTGSWIGSTSGSAPSGSNTNITLGGITPSQYYPFFNTQSAHISILSYDTPVSSSYLMGTGEPVDIDTLLPGDIVQPATTYSVRKVRTAYTGFCMDVRRDLDDTTGSIGFDAFGNLDTGSLLAFVTGSEGTGSGFVARWYDQSGNNNHAVQTTTGSQPIIVESGSIILENGKPSIQFDGIDDVLNSGTVNLKYVVAVLNPKTPLNYEGFIGYNNRHVIVRYESTNTFYNFGSQLFPLPPRFFVNGVQTNTFVNSNMQLFAVGNNTVTTTNQFIQIGDDNAGSKFSSMNISELITYTDNQEFTNRPLIETNINIYYQLYEPLSFTIKADPTSISGSINNKLTSGIASSGPLGLITVSRTGSDSLTLARNGAVTSFNTPASGALSTGIYLGAINNNGIALGNSPMNLSFASVGTGLTNTEVVRYDSLVNALQFNLGRGKILDVQPDYSFAFSTRQLSPYSLYAMRVRRTGSGIGDNDELDIGFDSEGNLDTQTLLDFTGTDSNCYGYVSIWYDQSGNNKHATESQPQYQPLIVNQGEVTTLFGKPSIYNPEFGRGFVITNASNSSNYTLFMVTSTTGGGCILGTGNYRFHRVEGTNSIVIGSGGSEARISTNSNIAEPSLLTRTGINSYQIAHKNTVDVTTNPGIYGTPTISYLFYNQAGRVEQWIGYASELIYISKYLEPTDSIRNTFENNINNYYQIY